jgi:hypothetical protein
MTDDTILIAQKRGTKDDLAAALCATIDGGFQHLTANQIMDALGEVMIAVRKLTREAPN